MLTRALPGEWSSLRRTFLVWTDHLNVKELKNVISHCTLDLISWKILLKTCCLKCLLRYDTICWWAELSDSDRIRSHLNTGLVVKLLTHNIGSYDLKRKWSCFCCFSNLFENSLNVQCIHDIRHLLLIFDEKTKYEKIFLRQHRRQLVSLMIGEYKEYDSRPHYFYRLSKVNPTKTHTF